MKKLKELFKNAKENTGIDHTEWIETNRGDLRLFECTDWLSGMPGDIQAETGHGEVLTLSELTEDEIELFIELLTPMPYAISTSDGHDEVWTYYKSELEAQETFIYMQGYEDDIHLYKLTKTSEYEVIDSFNID